MVVVAHRFAAAAAWVAVVRTALAEGLACHTKIAVAWVPGMLAALADHKFVVAAFLRNLAFAAFGP